MFTPNLHFWGINLGSLAMTIAKWPARRAVPLFLQRARKGLKDWAPHERGLLKKKIQEKRYDGGSFNWADRTAWEPWSRWFLQLSHTCSGWGSFTLPLSSHQCIIHMAKGDAGRNTPRQYIYRIGWTGCWKHLLEGIVSFLGHSCPFLLMSSLHLDLPSIIFIIQFLNLFTLFTF